MKTTRWLWWVPWTLTALALFLFSVGATRAETAVATGSGFNWSLTLPANADAGAIVVQCYDCDVADEATLTVNGNPPITLFGADVPANDARTVPVTIPVGLVPGTNTLTFACLRRAGCFRVDGISAGYTIPQPVAPWLETAAGLLAAGWVPAWLSPDDEVWVVSREDTEATRVMLCATDAQTSARFATWVDEALARLPATAAPVADECARRWCFASGPGRAAEIAEVCP